MGRRFCSTFLDTEVKSSSEMAVRGGAWRVRIHFQISIRIKHMLSQNCLCYIGKRSRTSGGSRSFILLQRLWYKIYPFNSPATLGIVWAHKVRYSVIFDMIVNQKESK